MRALSMEEAEALRQLAAPGVRIHDQRAPRAVGALVARRLLVLAYYDGAEYDLPGETLEGYSVTALGQLALRVSVVLPAVSP